MLSYKMDFSSCGIVPGFGKSSHICIYVHRKLLLVAAYRPTHSFLEIALSRSVCVYACVCVCMCVCVYVCVCWCINEQF